jgi:hypothetical protein
MTQDNRESWLNRVAAGMAPLFEALDAPPARAYPRGDRLHQRGPQGQGDRRVLG